MNLTVTRLLAPLLAVTLVAGACGNDDQVDTIGPGDTASTTIPDEAGGSRDGADEEPGDGSGVATCSADELREHTFDRQELPSTVATNREQIFRAATECDYAELEEVALTGAEPFTYSFGASDGQPAAYWRSLEEGGETADVKPMEALVLLLNTAFGTVEGPEGETIYVWPSAHAAEGWDAVTEAEKQALTPPYTPADLEQFDRAGSYLGWRIGIDEDGKWRYFVAGD